MADISRSPTGPIHVGGVVAQIAHTIKLQNKLTHLIPYCGFSLLDLNHYLEKGMVRQAYFKVNEYKLLINHEVVRHFFLPNPEGTNIRDRKNWTYALEEQDETPYRPATLPTLEYHPSPVSTSDRTHAISTSGTPLKKC